METLLFVAFVFILLGILIKHGKMYDLIAGYNTMSEKEKERYDIQGIATVFRNTMFGMALILIAGYLLGRWTANEKVSFYALILSVVIGLPYLLIRANSKKFRKPPEKKDS